MSSTPESAPKSLDKHTSPAAGTGAGGTNFSHGSGYDTGSNVKGYMGTPELLSSGQGYMTSPQGTGPGFGVNNGLQGQNTGIGMSGAGTGASGYHHGKGGTSDPAGEGVLSNSKEDAHTMKNIVGNLFHRKH